MWTKSAKNVQQQYDITKRSLDEKVNDNYYSTGEIGLQLRMQDFQNLPIEEAMQMQMPQFVANPQLYKKGQAYLDSKGYNVVIEEAPDGSFYKIKTKNGDNITEIATNDLILALGDDPVIQRGYAEQSFVEARMFANNLLEKGQVESVAEGENVWSNSKLTDMILKMESKVNEEQSILKEMEKKTQYYQDLIENGNGPIPGSPDDILAQSLIAKQSAVQQMYDRDSKLLSKLDAAQKNTDLNQKLNQTKAYQMQANLEADFKQAALMFSARNKEITLEVNEAEKFKRQKEFDLFKMRQKFNYDEELKRQSFEYDKKMEEIKQENRIDLAKQKGEIKPKIGPLKLPGLPLTMNNGKISTVVDPSQIFDAVGANNNVQKTQLDKIFDEMLTMLLNKETDGSANVSKTGVFSKQLQNYNKSLNIDAVKQHLMQLSKDNAEFQGFVLKQFQANQNTPEAIALYEKLGLIQNAVDEQNSVYKNNFNNLLSYDDNFREMFRVNNFPIPFDLDNNFMTEGEFTQALDDAAANGQINEEFIRELVPPIYPEHPTEKNMWQLTPQQVTSPNLRRPAGVELIAGPTEKLYVLPEAPVQQLQDGSVFITSDMLVSANSIDNVRKVANQLAQIYPDLKIVNEINPDSKMDYNLVTDLFEGKPDPNLLNPFRAPYTALEIGDALVGGLGLADRDLPNNSLYFKDKAGNSFSFDEIYEKFLKQQFNLSKQMDAEEIRKGLIGEDFDRPMLNVRGSSFVLKAEGGGIKSKAKTIYENIKEGLNRTLTGNITLNDGAQQVYTFKNYNLQSALGGEDPYSEVGDVFTSQQVVFGGSDAYISTRENLMQLQYLKQAVQSPSAIIYDMTNVDGDNTQGVAVSKNVTDAPDAIVAVLNAASLDDKKLNNYYFAYNNIDQDPNNANKASYTIIDANVADDEVKKVYKILIDLKDDNNPQALNYNDRVDPVLMKINRGENTKTMYYSENQFETPMPGLKYNIYKTGEKIYIKYNTYKLGKKNQIIEEREQFVKHNTTEKFFFTPKDDAKLYNSIILNLENMGLQLAKQLYTTKYLQRDNVNATIKENTNE